MGEKGERIWKYKLIVTKESWGGEIPYEEQSQ